MLWTDLIDPAELTGYVRASLEDEEQAKGTLARWLPNDFVADVVVRLAMGGDGLVRAAEYRSYDAETTIGSLPSGRRITMDLPPLGQKLRISEYDQLRGRNATDEQLRNSILKVARRTAIAVANRIELERGKAIETAAIAINENGFVQSSSWARNANRTVTAATLWSTTATAKPFDDLNAWIDVVGRDKVGAILTSSRVLAAMARTGDIRGLFLGGASGPSAVSVDQIQGSLQAFNLPPIYVYDRTIQPATGAAAKVLSDNKVFLLPAPTDISNPDGTDFGATVWGQTLESEEQDYEIQPEDRPGIVSGVWKTRDPIAAWVHSAAIGLPVLANPDLSLVGTVL